MRYKNVCLLAMMLFLSTCLDDDKMPGGIVADRRLPQCSNLQIGERSFWAYNLISNQYDCIFTVLKKQTQGKTQNGINWSYKVYVDIFDTNVARTMSETNLNDIQRRLDLIVAKNIEVFGEPPDPIFKEDMSIIFLIIDIQDNVGNDSYVAGFFDPINNNAFSSKSNQVNMLVLDGVEPFRDENKIADFYNTLAHEMQHLIHFGTDPNEETWVDEGMAEMASDLNISASGRSLFDPDPGLNCQTRKSSFYNCDIQTIPEFELPIALTSWENNVYHYYKTSLFFKYICEKQGSNCQKFLGDLVQNTETGLVGVEEALANNRNYLAKEILNYDTYLQQNESPSANFITIYQSWLVAMSKTAYDNFHGLEGVMQPGSLSANLGSHRYTSFSRSYPFWRASVADGMQNYPFSALSNFAALYYLWQDEAHPGQALELPNQGYGVITIDPQGNIDFNPLDLEGFRGLQIIYNTYINPDAIVSRAEPSGVSSMKTKESVEALVWGRLAYIGNHPFSELSLVTNQGQVFALELDADIELTGLSDAKNEYRLANLLQKSALGGQYYVQVSGVVAVEKSRRGNSRVIVKKMKIIE